ncbi:hypothetical protein [Mesonia aquimarina]|uniref:hypothetical protein n=1 Tax=Mesonia aquimarina TaxID=1504967 RepID=UPI0013CF0987|nr:hypothetical protein [Mesonia aquimarina]
MKTLAVIFILLFAAFLITPTAVTLIKHNADVSYVFNFSEEEEHTSGSSDENNVKENQWKLFSEGEPNFVFTVLNKKAFQIHYKRSTEIIYFELLSPPPEMA